MTRTGMTGQHKNVDAWLVLAMASLAGGVAVLHPATTLATALVTAWLVRRRVSGGLYLMAIACGGLSVIRASAHLDRHEQLWTATRSSLGAPARCAGSGTIVRSPTWSHGRMSSTLEVRALHCGQRAPFDATVRIAGGPDDLRRGDTVEFIAQLAPTRTFRNFGPLNPRPFAAQRGATLSGSALSVERIGRSISMGGWIDGARNHVRRRIIRTFAPEAQPMARALVLGENDLERRDAAAFRKSGLAHLLAVSGTHLVFAVVLLVRAARTILVRIPALVQRRDPGRWAAAMGIGLALTYADFAGGSGSAWRAAWMLTASFLARSMGRRMSGVRALAWSLLIGCMVDPLAALDISFALSAAATGGLIVIGQPLARLCDQVPTVALRWVAKSTVVTLSAMLPCVPLLMLLAPDMTAGGLLANLVAAPLGELIALPVCLTHAVAEPIPALEYGLASVGSGALLLIRSVAHWSADARALAVAVVTPTNVQLALVSMLGVAALEIRATAASGLRVRRRAAMWLVASVSALGVSELHARASGMPTDVLRVTALDVGQGDATLVDLPDGSAILVDGGGFIGTELDPGERVVLPVLRARRRKALRAIVVSHPHPDHFLGLTSVIQGVRVDEVWLTWQGERHGAGPAYTRMLKAIEQRGARIVRPSQLCRRRGKTGGATLQILAPCPGYVSGRSANDNSIVIRVAYGAHSVLLTGDAELEQERELVRRYGSRLRSTLLKVGHHGSRTSSNEAFLAHVRPAWATVSCGVRNRFGHPHPLALGRLQRSGAVLLPLDRLGSVAWQTDGSNVSIRTFVPRSL